MTVVGSVAVIRVGGGVTFAEKVRLAERNGAGGVLIYPDPADLPQDPRRLGLNTHTAVSEHVTHTRRRTCLHHPPAPGQSVPPSVLTNTGPPGLRGPLYPWLSFVQSHPVPVHPVLWSATRSRPANKRHRSCQTAQVHPPPSQVELRWGCDFTDLCMFQPADRTVLSSVVEGSAALCTLRGWSSFKLRTQGQDVSQQ